MSPLFVFQEAMTTVIVTEGSPVPQTAPVVPSAGVVPLPFTKMPLHDWAERLGLNPIHFSGGTVSGRFSREQACSTPWPRYTWQNGYNLSHMDLAVAIQNAESMIEQELRFHVAPAFRRDNHVYPRYQNTYRTTGYDMTGRRASIQVERGKIISVSVEKRDFLGTYAVSYQDLDGDGYNEAAYVLVPDTAEFHAASIHLFPSGLSDHPSWQLRYPKRWGVAGDDRYYILDYWLMLNPEIMSRLPGENWNPPSLDNEDNLLTHVDAYHVWADNTDTSAVSLEWENAPLGLSQYDTISSRGGLGIVRDSEAGLVAPTWLNDSGWCSTNGSPDRVSISYYSGEVSQEYLSGYTLNPLGGHLGDAVFYLATARLTREMCACAEARQLAIELRQDMSLVSPQGNFLAVADAIQTCPFGTRRGEWLAYQNIKSTDRHIEVAIL